ncbi:nitrobindin family protein [Rathayibacter soli]|uniref:FABP family protein n=1 Tax=Rathayibacter soli TaxID=3144168 RepID=UPI0027E3E654|nr:FABP family protein [Glaciibacter superstes]
MIEIPSGLSSELVPLSWLLGVWEGTGVIDYKIGANRVQHAFGQRISFSHDGLPFVNYSAFSWQLDDDATPLAAETGYWRLHRPRVDGDPGPGMLPPTGTPPFTDAEAVERLRSEGGGFDIEAMIVHPEGVSELYFGSVAGPRIDLATDAVMRTSGAKDYAAATRMYGLVESHLLWAWDIAALGQDLRTHASARLARVQ